MLREIKSGVNRRNWEHRFAKHNQIKWRTPVQKIFKNNRLIEIKTPHWMNTTEIKHTKMPGQNKKEGTGKAQ